MNKREINNLLVQIQEGDNLAFENLYKQTSSGVYSFIYTYMKDTMDCEDVMQVVYMKIKMNIHQYKPNSNGVAWILQIAKTTALNELRSKENYRKLQALSYTDVYDNSSLEGKPLMKLMKQVLKEDEQQIIILHVIWRTKHKDIAKALNLPIGTVTSKYKRAIEKLKRAWKEEQK